MKKVIITITETGKIIVMYEGMWGRKDIERTHIAMLKELPAHIQKKKMEDAKIKEEEKIKEKEN